MQNSNTTQATTEQIRAFYYEAAEHGDAEGAHRAALALEGHPEAIRLVSEWIADAAAMAD